MTPREAELLAALRETREACAAAMRVIADLDLMTAIGCDLETRQERFVEEAKLAGVTDGFGKRADELIQRLEGETVQA